MLAGLADFTLFHSGSHITPHLGPIPPALQLGDHPLDSCVSLFVGVPFNTQQMAAGQTTLSRSGRLPLGANVIVSSPSSSIRSESQRNSAHPCLSCSSLGRRPFLARYTSATTPRKAFLEFPQLCNVICQDGVGAEGLYSPWFFARCQCELTLVPVILSSRSSQCL